MASGRSRRQDGTQVGDARILRLAGYVLLGFLVIGGGLFIGSLVMGGGAPGSSRPEATPAGLPSSALSTPATTPTTSPSPSRSTAPVVRPGAMRAFVRSYLATVTDDQAAAWQQLTPRFRNLSGGFARYRRFWGDIAVASPRGLVADPEARTVAYQVDYTMRDGTRTTDRTRLHLVLDDGRYLIAGEG